MMFARRWCSLALIVISFSYSPTSISFSWRTCSSIFSSSFSSGSRNALSLSLSSSPLSPCVPCDRVRIMGFAFLEASI
uniref:Putative secreted protein n=1 Tax=Anopheles darlingi TaxID=43151 RepID=A0A2M4DNP4_ANODA